MLTCKSVSKSLSNGDYKDLPFLKRISLKLHVALCFVCGRYNKQVMQMQDTCRHFRSETRDQGDVINKSLSSSKKFQLQAVLQQEVANQEKNN